jgi:hypothetical protein
VQPRSLAQERDCTVVCPLIFSPGLTSRVLFIAHGVIVRGLLKLTSSVFIARCTRTSKLSSPSHLVMA